MQKMLILVTIQKYSWTPSQVLDMSVRLWNFTDGGSYNARFLPKNQHTQRIFFQNNPNELWLVKKCRNHTFKVNFLS